MADRIFTSDEADEIVKSVNPLEAFGFPEGTTHTGNENRKTILEFASQARANDLVEHAPCLGWEFTIPPLDWVVLTTKYPELISSDKETHKSAWQKFARSAEADIYRVHAKPRHRAFNGIIVK